MGISSSPFLAVRVADVGGGMAEEVGHLHAGNRHRPLEGQEQSRPRPLVRLHLQQVLARPARSRPPVTS